MEEVSFFFALNDRKLTATESPDAVSRPAAWETRRTMRFCSATIPSGERCTSCMAAVSIIMAALMCPPFPASSVLAITTTCPSPYTGERRVLMRCSTSRQVRSCALPRGFSAAIAAGGKPDTSRIHAVCPKSAPMPRPRKPRKHRTRQAEHPTAPRGALPPLSGEKPFLSHPIFLSLPDPVREKPVPRPL